MPAAAAAGFVRAGPLPGLGSGRIWGVAVDPAVPARILAATDSGVFTSADGGATWSLTLPGVRVWSVGFDARNAQNAFAGTGGSGVFASGDAGTTWSPSSSGLPSLDVRSFAFGLDGIAAATDDGVAVSPDGHTWHSDGLEGVSVSSVAVAANSPQFALVAGADNGNLSSGSLFQSTGSSAWSVLQAGLPAAAVVSSVTAGPIDSAVPKRPLLVTTSKGAFRSGDGGTTWTSSGGVPVQLTLTTALFDPLDPSVVYAGADAAGSTGGDLVRSTDGGQTFSLSDAGLTVKNVEAIALGPTNPLLVVVAVDPPTGGGIIYTETAAGLPPPPKLLPEAPGQRVPTVVATPTPRPTPTVAALAPATPTPAPPSGLQKFAGAAFHWPTPLVYEIIFVLLVAYAIIRWRQRYYVEGPP